MKTFKLTIATLNKTLLADDILAVYFPTPNGEIGVLANHMTYLANTLTGKIRYTTRDKKNNSIELSRPGLFFIQDNQARLWVC